MKPYDEQQRRDGCLYVLILAVHDCDDVKMMQLCVRADVDEQLEQQDG